MDATKALRALIPPMTLAAGTGFAVALMITMSPPSGAPGVRVKSNQGFLVAEVTGRELGLYPGTSELRSVRVTNPNDFEIEVDSLGAATGAPLDRHGQPVAGCLAAVAQVRPLGAPLRVPANSAREVTITVRLAATAQRACRNFRFTLTYSGTARRP